MLLDLESIDLMKKNSVVPCSTMPLVHGTGHFRGVVYVYCMYPTIVVEVRLPSVQLSAVAHFACCG